MALIKPERYTRKTFSVEAIEVTEANMAEVAEWCGGEVRDTDPDEMVKYRLSQQYILVPVRNPLSERQERAYLRDWVLLGGPSDRPTGFKVYTPKAFVDSFEKQVDRMFDVVNRMEKRAEREEREEDDEMLPFEEGSIRRATDPSEQIAY